jgi:hypothetical protein
MSKSKSTAMQRLASILSCLLLALPGCSRQHGESAPAGETTTAGAPGASVTSKEAAVDAAKTYVAALGDGGWQGIFQYDHEYRNAAESAKASVPPSMWPERERALQADWEGKLEQQRHGSLFDVRNGGDCSTVLKSGATIDFSRLETRQAPDGTWQAFVPFSYALLDSAPAATFTAGDERKVKAGLVSLEVETSGINGTAPFVRRTCAPVDGTFIAWERPPLTKDMAAGLAAKAGVLPSSYTAVMSGQNDPRAFATGLPASRWGQGGWAEFVAASERLKALLQSEGFVVSGFDRPSPGYYAMGGMIHLSDEQAKWIVRSVNYGRYVALLTDSTSELTTFEQNGGEAQGVFQTRFKQVTPFGKLWKDLQAQSMVDGVFSNAFSDVPPVTQDLEQAQTATTVKFRFDGAQGWVVAQ